MDLLKKALQSTPVVYVTRDLERAIGLPSSYKGYFIITNDGPFAKEYSRKHKNVIIVTGKQKLDTRELLVHPKTNAFINKLKNPRILVFKNTKQIETICADQGWILFNPSAELASRVEEKLSQLEWLGNLQKYLPPHKVMRCKDLTWPLVCHSEQSEESLKLKRKGSFTAFRMTEKPWTKYIVQFNRAHTGTGTMLIESQKQIDELKKQFPDRDVRVTQFISGPAFTNNNIVWRNKIVCGGLNYQITGLSPFTDNPFATIGNDWSLPDKLVNHKQLMAYHAMVMEIGTKLMANGWKGLFGVDTILDEKTGKAYLIEINARQPASTTFESQLQKTNTTFEAHLSALLDLEPTGIKIARVKNGAQIIQRVKNEGSRLKNMKPLITKFKKLKLNVIKYNNTEPGADWLRIQSKKGIMAGHNKFNDLGEKIVHAISGMPPIMHKVGFDFDWDSKKVWALSEPVQEMDIKKLLWHFDIPFWEKEGMDDWNLTPWEFIKNPKRQPSHLKKVNQANLDYPLNLMENKGNLLMLDGLHRLVKAYLNGEKKVRVRIIPRSKIPLIKKVWKK